MTRTTFLPWCLQLVLCGARAIGLSERRAAAFVDGGGGAGFFPEDFPDTGIHCERVRDRARRELARQALLPPAVRAQRRRALPPSPFPPVAAWAGACSAAGDPGTDVARYWVLRGEDGRRALSRLVSGVGGAGDKLVQQALVRVDVRMCGPGIPAEGDAVCFPLPADAGAPHSRAGPSDGQPGVEAPVSRPVVGFVTSGGYGARRGRGVGTAFVSAVALVGLYRVSPQARQGGGGPTPRDALVMIQGAAAGCGCHAAWARAVF